MICIVVHTNTLQKPYLFLGMNAKHGLAFKWTSCQLVTYFVPESLRESRRLFG
jgi:hypothetical protein